jgi:hypothetical protein
LIQKEKKQIIRDEIGKEFQLKKRIRTTKNNNKKMRTIFDIKIKCQGMKFKDINSRKDSRPKTS